MSRVNPEFVTKLRRVADAISFDAKRKPHLTSGIESWYPYYAGYTERFASHILGEIGRGARLRILDPWNGSGTTTRVAHMLGHQVIGYDLNPFASIVASAKIAHPDDALHVLGLTRRLSRCATRPVSSDDPLLVWLSRSVVAQYRSIEYRLIKDLGTDPRGLMAIPIHSTPPPLFAFLLLALVRTAKDVAILRQGSNPTWIRPGCGRRRVVHDLGSRWTARVAKMAQDLVTENGALCPPWAGVIGVADSRALPIPDETIDIVLTSPPYCTRIDYFVNSAFELSALGISSSSSRLQALRRDSMGTPLARVGPPPEIPLGWPSSIQRLLHIIRTHYSKASRSYYFKTFWQYFSDAQMSLREIHRVLRPGGCAICVVQSSFYKDVYIDLPELYIEMGAAVGFEGQIVCKTAVRRALAQINPHAARHRQNGVCTEAIIGLEKAS